MTPTTIIGITDITQPAIRREIPRDRVIPDITFCTVSFFIVICLVCLTLDKSNFTIGYFDLPSTLGKSNFTKGYFDLPRVLGKSNFTEGHFDLPRVLGKSNFTTPR